MRTCRGLLAGAALIAWIGIPASSVPAQDALPVVLVAPTLVQSAPPLRLTGTITAERSSSLSPRVSGFVVRADVDAGHVAKRGAVLITLDPTLAQIEQRSAEARLAEARARLTDAMRLREEAQALGENIAQSTLRTRGAQVEIETAIVARLEAEYRYAAEVVARHSVTAPFDGVVVRKLTEVGEWVEAGQSILEFVGTDRLRLDVQVPQEHYVGISQTTSALVKIDAYPDDRFTGQVSTKVPVGDPNARTFLVRVLLDDPAHEIIPGMSAEIEFVLPNGATAIEIPRDSIVRYPDGTTSVWVVENAEDGLVARERKVVLGGSLGANVKVIDGLASNTYVVVRGNEVLEDGASVQPVDRLPDSGLDDGAG